MNRQIFGLTILLCSAAGLSLAVGSTGMGADWEILSAIRAPRVFTAILAGAGTAAAGALSQSLFRNSLATPSIIGTEAGASFALALATLVAVTNGIQMERSVIVSSIGAILATLASLSLLRLKHGRSLGSINPQDSGLARLLLGGFALNAFLAAGTSLCISILMERGSSGNLQHWLMGSFTARSWDHAAGMGLAYLVCLSAAWSLAPGVDVMSLGDDSAKSLGVDVARSYKLILIVISVLIGSAISFGGPLPFLGLVAPHMARLISRQQLRTVLIISSLLGAILAVSADLAARTVRAPVDMDVGLITTMIGAPYFLWLLVRRASA